MSTELMTQELQIAKQEVEILKLKLELQKMQMAKVSKLEDSLFSPALMSHYQKVSEVLAKSSIIPSVYRGKPEDIFVAISFGYQLGFPVEQALQDIAVINGRPTVWGDGLAALVVSHPECEGYNEEPIYKGDTIFGYTCTVLRKGHAPHSKTFTLEDASRAKLLGKQGPWSQYPERMLQLRARSFALRDKFPDALRGLKSAEEARDGVMDENDTINAEIVPEKKATTSVEKLKTILKPVDEISKEPEIEFNNDDPINPEQYGEIERLLEEKNFNEERRQKAFSYFKVESVSEMTQSKANEFLQHLARI